MNKYQYAKNELKNFTEGNSSLYKNYVKAVQRELADFIINDCIPNGYNAVKVPFPNWSYWYFPMPKKHEKTTGYRSRLMAWCLLYIAENLTRRWNDEEQNICEFIFPEDIPSFGLEGLGVIYCGAKMDGDKNDT